MDQKNIVLDCYSNLEIKDDYNNILRVAKRFEKIALIIGLPALLLNIFVFIIFNFYSSKIELFYNLMNMEKIEFFIILSSLAIMYINPLIEIFLGFIGMSAIFKTENKKKNIAFKLSILNMIIGFSSYLMTIITIISSLKFIQSMMTLLF